MGFHGYNCSSFASPIVKAAGVSASAGLIFDTPGEIALGKKLKSKKLK